MATASTLLPVSCSWKGKLGKPRGRVRSLVRYASATVAPDPAAPAASRGESMLSADASAEFGRLGQRSSARATLFFLCNALMLRRSRGYLAWLRRRRSAKNRENFEVAAVRTPRYMQICFCAVCITIITGVSCVNTSRSFEKFSFYIAGLPERWYDRDYQKFFCILVRLGTI